MIGSLFSVPWLNGRNLDLNSSDWLKVAQRIGIFQLRHVHIVVVFEGFSSFSSIILDGGFLSTFCVNLTPLYFPDWSSLLTFYLLFSSWPEVLNASLFRYFVALQTIIPLKIQTAVWPEYVYFKKKLLQRGSKVREWKIAPQKSLK